MIFSHSIRSTKKELWNVRQNDSINIYHFNYILSKAVFQYYLPVQSLPNVIDFGNCFGKKMCHRRVVATVTRVASFSTTKRCRWTAVVSCAHWKKFRCAYVGLLGAVCTAVAFVPISNTTMVGACCSCSSPHRIGRTQTVCYKCNHIWMVAHCVAAAAPLLWLVATAGVHVRLIQSDHVIVIDGST